MIEDSASSSLRLANHTKRTLQTICLTFDKCSQIFILQSDASADFSNVHYTDCILKKKKEKARTVTCFVSRLVCLEPKTNASRPPAPAEQRRTGSRDVFLIIWLNCAWCAIRMEISPVRDDKYFMRVIWAEQFWSADDELALFILFFSPSDELIESFRRGRQTDRQSVLRWLRPAERRRGWDLSDSRRLCPNGTRCLTQLPGDPPPTPPVFHV